MILGHARYKNLLDVGFHLAGSHTQHLGIGGHRAQVHQLQPLALNLLDHHAQNLLLGLIILWQKNQTSAILTFLGHRDTLQQNKLMGYLYHDTRTITGFVACLGATVFHVLKHLQCIVNQVMTFSAVDIYHHTHAASIMLVAALIESLLITFCHIILC